MSNDDSIDKDRLYFTQCNDTILLRCPECTSTKILRQCKIFHNLPAVWWHIKQGHKDILESRLQEIIQVLNNLFKAYKWNMFPKWAFSEAKIEPTTTSSSILFDGRPPRIDSWDKIVKIAKLLKIQSEHYPNYKPKPLKSFVKVILDPVDSRTLKKYVDCVITYSTPDKIKGKYDVTQFCNKVGV